MIMIFVSGGSLLLIAQASSDVSFSTFLPILVLSIGVLLILLLRRITGDWLAPPIILLSAWTLTIFAASFDVTYLGYYSFFNVPIALTTWLVVSGAIACFVLGSLMVLKLQIFRQRSHTSDVDLGKAYSSKRLVIAIFVCFLIGSSVFVYSAITAGELPVFSSSVYEIRSDFRLAFWNNFYGFFIAVIVFTGIHVSLFGDFRRSLLPIILSCFSFLALISTTERFDSWTSFMISGVIYYVVRRNQILVGKYTAKKLTRRRVIQMSLFGATTILIISAYIYIGGVRASAGLPSNQIVDIPNETLAQLYIYSYAPGIKNLQTVINGDMGMSYGLLIVRPILWFLRIREPVTVEDIFSGPNTATWLYYYYLDFGYLGVFLIPLCLGIVCTLVYRNIGSNGSMAWAILYGVLANCILWSVATERFFEPSTSVYAVILLVVHLCCRTRSSSKRSLARA
jgi:oligosaccharide repeat unit polymerase